MPIPRAILPAASSTSTSPWPSTSSCCDAPGRRHPRAHMNARSSRVARVYPQGCVPEVVQLSGCVTRLATEAPIPHRPAVHAAAALSGARRDRTHPAVPPTGRTLRGDPPDARDRRPQACQPCLEAARRRSRRRRRRGGDRARQQASAAAPWSAPVTISAAHSGVGPVGLTSTDTSTVAWWRWQDGFEASATFGDAFAARPVGTGAFGPERLQGSDEQISLDMQGYGAGRLLALSQALGRGPVRAGQPNPPDRVLVSTGGPSGLRAPTTLARANLIGAAQLGVAPSGRALVAFASYDPKIAHRAIVSVARRAPSSALLASRGDLRPRRVPRRGGRNRAPRRHGRGVRAQQEGGRPRAAPAPRLGFDPDARDRRRSDAVDAAGCRQRRRCRPDPVAPSVRERSHGRRRAPDSEDGSGSLALGRPQHDRAGRRDEPFVARRDTRRLRGCLHGARRHRRVALDAAREPHEAAHQQQAGRGSTVGRRPGCAARVVRAPRPARDDGACSHPSRQRTGLGVGAFLAPGAAGFGPIEAIAPAGNIAPGFDRDGVPLVVWSAPPDVTDPALPTEARAVVRTSARTG